MRLLHGSNVEIRCIDLSECGFRNDFGRGFYLTPSWQRAWEMGRRRKIFDGGEIVVNAFNFDEATARVNLKTLSFSTFSTQWARFVIQNRESRKQTHDYDLVIGPVADAVFDRELEKYKQEFGEAYMADENLRTFVGRISQFGLNYIQYCFCTPKALKYLHRK